MMKLEAYRCHQTFGHIVYFGEKLSESQNQIFFDTLYQIKIPMHNVWLHVINSVFSHF